MPKKQVIIQRNKRVVPAKKQKPPTVLGKALRSLGAAGGATVGSWLGNPAMGGAVGRSLGAAVSRWLGSGDYTVNSNSIVQSSLKAASSIPMMHAESQTVVIRHREYLGEVRSNMEYTVENSFQLNPGNNRAFPWLSSIATSFQEYKFRGVVFHYIPSSGSAINGTNAALGTVMMQTSYRATDAPPSSKVEMLNEYCSNESVPSEPFAHPIECNPRENPFNVLYVRSGQVPTTDTIMMYDLGITHIATSGNPADGNVLGDLWVTYEVELKKPIVASNVATKELTGSAYFMSTSGVGIFNNKVRSVGPIAISGSGNVLTLPKGCVGLWQITVILYPSSPTTGFVAPTKFFASSPTAVNCTLTTPMTADFGHIGSEVETTGAKSNQIFAVLGVRIDDPAVVPAISFATPTLGGTLSATIVNITPTYGYGP